MLKLSTLMVGSDNAEGLVKFYTGVLGDPPWKEGPFTGWDLGGTYFMIGAHSEVHGPNETPGRMIMMLETADVESEAKRIADLGAKLIAKPYHPGKDEGMMLATFADTDGNYFQLASPMKM